MYTYPLVRPDIRCIFSLSRCTRVIPWPFFTRGWNLSTTVPVTVIRLRITILRLIWWLIRPNKEWDLTTNLERVLEKKIAKQKVIHTHFTLSCMTSPTRLFPKELCCDFLTASHNFIRDLDRLWLRKKMVSDLVHKTKAKLCLWIRINFNTSLSWSNCSRVNSKRSPRESPLYKT